MSQVQARQGQARQFPGFGVVYLENGGGIKVVRTYTQGPKKIIEGDGSVSYSTPPPTIHELFGGGFVYEDGNPVKVREHLENITDIKMKERALIWFDGKRDLSEVAKKDIPPLVKPEDRERPEPVFVISSDVVADLEKGPEKVAAEPPVNKETGDLNRETGQPLPDTFSQILGAIENLAKKVGGVVSDVATMKKEWNKEITELKKRPPAPRRMAMSEAAHKKQSEAMKKRWADPEYKAKMISKGVLGKWKDKGVGENQRDKKKEEASGKDSPEAGPEVQTV